MHVHRAGVDGRCARARRRPCRAAGRCPPRRPGPGRPPPPRMSARSVARSRPVQYHPAAAGAAARGRPAAATAGAARAEQRQVRRSSGSSAAAAHRCGASTCGLPGSSTVASTGRPNSVSGWCGQVGVQRVVPRDEHGQRALPGPAGPAGLLPQRGPGARLAGEQHGIQAGDVDAELERGGRGQPEQPPGLQVRLQRPALLGQVAGRGRPRPAPARSGRPRQQPTGGRATTVSAARRERTKATVRTPSATRSASRSATSAVADRRTGRLVLPGQLGQRWLPQREQQLAAGRAVVGHRRTSWPTSRAAAATSGSARSPRRARRPGRPVVRADPPQPAQHRGHVRAEDAPVAVALVDDDVPQVAQEAGPPGVAGQDRAVQHVGVGQHVDACWRTQSRSSARGVAVVRRRPHAGRGASRDSAAAGRPRAPWWATGTARWRRGRSGPRAVQERRAPAAGRPATCRTPSRRRPPSTGRHARSSAASPGATTGRSTPAPARASTTAGCVQAGQAARLPGRAGHALDVGRRADRPAASREAAPAAASAEAAPRAGRGGRRQRLGKCATGIRTGSEASACHRSVVECHRGWRPTREARPTSRGPTAPIDAQEDPWTSPSRPAPRATAPSSRWAARSTSTPRPGCASSWSTWWPTASTTSWSTWSGSTSSTPPARRARRRPQAGPRPRRARCAWSAPRSASSRSSASPVSTKVFPIHASVDEAVAATE